jgi:hypothetical protein
MGTVGALGKAEFAEMMERWYGSVPAWVVTRLYNRWCKTRAEPLCYPTSPDGVDCLMNALYLPNLMTGRTEIVVLDPCAGTQGITSCLTETLCDVPLCCVTNDIHPSYQTDYCLFRRGRA